MKNSAWVLLIIFFSCSPSRKMPANQSGHSSILIDGKIFASVFQQQAAEYKALCLQAYNIARWRVDQAVVQNKPLAVITDIDETLFDNSDYQVHEVLSGKDFELPSWYEWTAMGRADTIPGSLSFFQYAASKGIQIFYITNREERERTGTLQNLNKFHFPNADNEHLMVRQTTSSKEERRIRVSEKFDVIVLLGDNLSDFSNVFDTKVIDERKARTDQSAAEFGKRFIVFPNPVYGDWESDLYKSSHSLNAAEKDSVLKSTLRGY